MASINDYEYITTPGWAVKFQSPGVSVDSRPWSKFSSIVNNRQVDESRPKMLFDDLLKMDENIDIQIMDDNEYVISDGAVEYYKKYLTDYRYFDGIFSEKEKFDITHNIISICAYKYFEKPKQNICLGYVTLNIVMDLSAVIRRASITEPIKYPGKFWNFYVDWVAEHSDCFEKMSMQRPMDIEAEIVSSFTDAVKNILFNDKEDNSKK